MYRLRGRAHPIGDFSLHHHVVPHISKFRLEDAGKVLELMHQGKVRGRAVLVLR